MPEHGGLVTTTSFGATRTTVSVEGELDVATGPALAGLLAALIGDRPEQLALDLAGVRFVDAGGIRAIAATVRLAEVSGGSLTIEAAPPLVRRLLGIVGLSRLCTPATPAAAPVAALGTEQHAEDGSRPVVAVPRSLVADLAGMASVAASTKVTDAALQLVTTIAEATVEGADGVSVTLDRHQVLATVASSNGTVLRMDHHQYETGEGPCLSAASTGHWFHAESLAEEDRWPVFTPRALEEGIASILSTPLVVAGRPMGALNIYSSADRAFGPPQQELAALFASQASMILTDAGPATSAEAIEIPIAVALVARETIAQAQGVLMARRRISADEASTELYRMARRLGTTVERHATAVVADTTPPGSVPVGS